MGVSVKWHALRNQQNIEETNTVLNWILLDADKTYMALDVPHHPSVTGFIPTAWSKVKPVTVKHI